MIKMIRLRLFKSINLCVNEDDDDDDVYKKDNNVNEADKMVLMILMVTSQSILNFLFL